MSENVWFTSDLHLSHKKIIQFSERPFDSVEEMDEELVRRWNDVVRPGDRVYCLGDFSFADEERSIKFAKRLVGQKFMVWGNHDKKLRRSHEFMSQWIWQKDLTSIDVTDQKIALCHFPMLTWHQSHRGSWNLHGHSHGSLPDDPGALRLDVGVDCWDYAPVEFSTLKQRMSKKTFIPIDHHRAD
jgi:calcineurin-like phosphoesterase family protein